MKRRAIEIAIVCPLALALGAGLFWTQSRRWTIERVVINDLKVYCQSREPYRGLDLSYKVVEMKWINRVEFEVHAGVWPTDSHVGFPVGTVTGWRYHLVWSYGQWKIEDRTGETMLT